MMYNKLYGKNQIVWTELTAVQGKSYSNGGVFLVFLNEVAV